MLSIRFLAVIVTGFAVIAPAAHLFVLLNKINMPQDAYFTVQSIYNGWWIVGLALPLALIANLALGISSRQDATSFRLALVAAGLIALNLVIFVIWTQPANSATINWTLRPDNWQALRHQWEYSHAVNAAVTFLAFCVATVAALRTPG